ncbi:hypothetical protein WJX73_000636 [Symbiochloris irregularis]|uniref:hydroxyacylglutathione hydrolase n=1 Tax=Symbiochloris irregularis TaxID=706552 RepID=A0AAW1NUT8_9CHLO
MHCGAAVKHAIVNPNVALRNTGRLYFCFRSGLASAPASLVSQKSYGGSCACPRLNTLSRSGVRCYAAQQAPPADYARTDFTSDVVKHARIEAQRIPCLSDNYAWLLTDTETGKTAVVDPSESKPVQAVLEQRDRKLDFILNTHHHWDHTGGNIELKEKYGSKIVGPAADHDRIPGIDTALADGDTWDFGSLKMHVFDTPGHTKGHITLWFPEAEALFPGDTLFVLGCGRLFEGSPKQMWSSLRKMIPLPPSTRIFCAHEYTQSNARFALHVNPDSTAMQQRKREIDAMRAQGIATVPSLLRQELECNPFLRPGDPGIRRSLGIPADASDEDAFAAIRQAKDKF